MALSVKHKFQSQKADGADTSLIRPSNWNDEHDLVMAGPRLVGRVAAGQGVAGEISVSADLTLSGNMLSLSDAYKATLTNHIGSGGSAHAVVTTTVNGFMVAADKVKLDGIAEEATKNATDAQLRDRATHTGEQAISTITGLQALLDTKASFYTGTNQNEQDMPLGTSLLVLDGSNVQRNQTYGIFLRANEAGSYTFNGANSIGAMVGTWRSRGITAAYYAVQMERIL